jgi:hypothetical protein
MFVVHLPTVIGLIVCEQVIVEKDTDNVSLINCFTNKRVGSFPSSPQRLAVATFMTDGLGTIPMELTIKQLDTLDVIESQSVSVRFPSRLQEVRFLFRWSNCVFPAAGDYDICLLTRNELLAQHRMRVS